MLPAQAQEKRRRAVVGGAGEIEDPPHMDFFSDSRGEHPQINFFPQKRLLFIVKHTNDSKIDSQATFSKRIKYITNFEEAS